MERIEHLAHRWRERLIGEVLVGPHGVAADVGAFDHVQDRHHRRVRKKSDITVPLVGDASLRGFQLHDLRMVVIRARKVRMNLELTELAAERDMTVEGEFLIGEEQHQMLEEGDTNRRDVVLGGSVEVDAGHFGAERRPNPTDAKSRHCGEVTKVRYVGSIRRRTGGRSGQRSVSCSSGSGSRSSSAR